ncbi:hypothetical protein ACHAPJ_011557 [Fusarium lateritium]
MKFSLVTALAGIAATQAAVAAPPANGRLSAREHRVARAEEDNYPGGKEWKRADEDNYPGGKEWKRADEDNYPGGKEW